MDLTALRASVAQEGTLERSVGAPNDRITREAGATSGRAPAAWLTGILVTAAALRFLRLSGQSLWLDEVLSIARARTILVEGFDTQLLNGHGPLFFYLLAPLLALNHPTEFLLRLPSALFGVGLVLVMYFLGREFDGRRGGLVAAFVTAVSPFAIWYSQEARYVNLFMLLAALSLLFARRFDRGLRDQAFYVVSTLLMLFSFVAGVFLILAQNAWFLLIAKARGPALRRWLLAQVVVALLFLPWFVRAYGIDLVIDPLSEEGSSNFSVAELKAGYPRATQPLQIGYVFLVYGVGYSFGPSTQDLHHNPNLQPVRAKAAQVVAAVALIGLVGVGGLARSLRRSPRDAALLVLCVACPILGAYLMSSVSQIAFNVRYTSAAYPAFALLFSAGLLWWKERFPVGALVLAGVGVMLGVSLFNNYGNPEYFKEDSRGAARLLEQLRKPEERVVVGASVIPFEYYYHKPFERWNQVELLREPAPADPASRGPDRVWVAATRTWQSPGFQSFLDGMRACYPVENRYVLPGYEILSYRLSSTNRPATCTLEAARTAQARARP
jgi:4-amino-4-deoxy-L-arabinose transferase-like glycosyltransferase